MIGGSDFDRLLSEGNAEPTEGWDFSWLDGRATESRPSWRYLESLTQRIDRADAVVDIQTGVGEQFAQALRNSEKFPETLAATESWPPNVVVARRALVPLGVDVAEVPDGDPFPFDDETFNLVCSRHPTVNNWSEVHRVLKHGGIYFSQQIGAGGRTPKTACYSSAQGFQRIFEVGN